MYVGSDFVTGNWKLRNNDAQTSSEKAKRRLSLDVHSVLLLELSNPAMYTVSSMRSAELEEMRPEQHFQPLLDLAVWVEAQESYIKSFECSTSCSVEKFAIHMDV